MHRRVVITTPSPAIIQNTSLASEAETLRLTRDDHAVGETGARPLEFSSGVVNPTKISPRVDPPGRSKSSAESDIENVRMSSSGIGVCGFQRLSFV